MPFYHGVPVPNPVFATTRVYVASSWRNNDRYPAVVAALKEMGFDVYDFKNPGEGKRGFGWSEVSRAWGRIDEHWKKWTTQEYLDALQTPIAQQGFKNDMEALKACDICVLVMPCGRSAHLEAGWATGAGKKTLVLWAEGEEAELMNKMHHGVYGRLNELVYEVAQIALTKPPVVPPPSAIDLAIGRALTEVKQEVEAQAAKWGLEHDQDKTGPEWIALLVARLGKLFDVTQEALHEAGAKDHRRVVSSWRKRLAQIAAVAVSALIAIDKELGETTLQDSPLALPCGVCGQVRDPITVVTTLEIHRCVGCGMPYQAPDPERPFRALPPPTPVAKPRKVGARRARRERNQQAALLSPPKR